METITLKPTTSLNLKFKGQILGYATNQDNDSQRWCNYTLYQDEHGQYIGEIEFVSLWQDEHDYVDAAICKSIEAVINFFGVSELTRALFEDAGLDYSDQGGQ